MYGMQRFLYWTLVKDSDSFHSKLSFQVFSVSYLGRLMANMFVSGSVRVQYVVAYLVFSVTVSLYIAS